MSRRHGRATVTLLFLAGAMFAGPGPSAAAAARNGDVRLEGRPLAGVTVSVGFGAGARLNEER